MDESRRRAYLGAMGVTIWEARTLSGFVEAPPTFPQIAPDSAAEETPAPAARPSAPASRPPILLERQAPAQPSSDPGDEPEATPSAPGEEPVEHMDWERLEQAVADCRRCGLWESRTRTVFGVGDRRARLMIIGEAPGADEDRAGEPFVGRAGQLLNRMLAAIGFQRDQVYIANVLKCRPPGNRDPRPDEALHCQDYLLRQVELIAPCLILAVGRVAAQNLLRTDVNVGRLRGRWFEFGPAAVPLRVTYHPAYLLRSPEQKAKAWKDLVEVRRRLDQNGA